MARKAPKQPSKQGGDGGSSDWASKRETREHLRLLEAMVYGGWEIPPDVFAEAPRRLAEIIGGVGVATRDRIRAMEALSSLAQQRMDASLQLDRIRRLDNGNATDRVEVMNRISDEQIKAVADSIASMQIKGEI